MNDQDKIISTHLGKSGDGSIVKPYETPDHIDPSLLVSVPRSWNRTQYGIVEGELPFVGYDVWNAYEFSALTDSGFPVVGQLKIVYNADSPCIVESKSLKLYLNSFNMARLGRSQSIAIAEAEKIIKHDLVILLGDSVEVGISFGAEFPITEFDFGKLDELDVSKLSFVYNETPSLLTPDSITNAFPETPFSFYARTSALRSNCRVTHQPDWGDVYIHLLGKQIPKKESLLQYIVSMRNENHFHEEICECIYKRLLDKFQPKDLVVACFYTRRGGIDINPVRASSKEMIDLLFPWLANANCCVQKTWRQ